MNEISPEQLKAMITTGQLPEGLDLPDHEDPLAMGKLRTGILYAAFELSRHNIPIRDEEGEPVCGALAISVLGQQAIERAMNPGPTQV